MIFTGADGYRLAVDGEAQPGLSRSESSEWTIAGAAGLRIEASAPFDRADGRRMKTAKSSACTTFLHQTDLTNYQRYARY